MFMLIAVGIHVIAVVVWVGVILRPYDVLCFKTLNKRSEFLNTEKFIIHLDVKDCHCCLCILIPALTVGFNIVVARDRHAKIVEARIKLVERNHVRTLSCWVMADIEIEFNATWLWSGVIAVVAAVWVGAVVVWVRVIFWPWDSSSFHISIE